MMVMVVFAAWSVQCRSVIETATLHVCWVHVVGPPQRTLCSGLQKGSRMAGHDVRTMVVTSIHYVACNSCQIRKNSTLEARGCGNLNPGPGVG